VGVVRKQNMAKHVAKNLVVDSGAFIKRAALHVITHRLFVLLVMYLLL